MPSSFGMKDHFILVGNPAPPSACEAVVDLLHDRPGVMARAWRSCAA
ncbi:MAG: hypothetical protein R3B35_07240 [Gemmatimonadales bacterium]